LRSTSARWNRAKSPASISPEKFSTATAGSAGSTSSGPGPPATSPAAPWHDPWWERPARPTLDEMLELSIHPLDLDSIDHGRVDYRNGRPERAPVDRVARAEHRDRRHADDRREVGRAGVVADEGGGVFQLPE